MTALTGIEITQFESADKYHDGEFTRLAHAVSFTRRVASLLLLKFPSPAFSRA